MLLDRVETIKSGLGCNLAVVCSPFGGSSLTLSCLTLELETVGIPVINSI